LGSGKSKANQSKKLVRSSRLHMSHVTCGTVATISLIVARQYYVPSLFYWSQQQQPVTIDHR
jgi:hypothetical protein